MDIENVLLLIVTIISRVNTHHLKNNVYENTACFIWLYIR